MASTITLNQRRTTQKPTACDLKTSKFSLHLIVYYTYSVPQLIGRTISWVSRFVSQTLMQTRCAVVVLLFLYDGVPMPLGQCKTMESLNTLVRLITKRPLTQEETDAMTEAIIEVRELMVFALKEKEKREIEARNEMMLPPWNR